MQSTLWGQSRGQKAGGGTEFIGRMNKTKGGIQL